MSIQSTGAPFLDFLQAWLSRLPVVSWKSILKKYTTSETALVSIDMVNGFCKKGNLASPRVGALIPGIVKLFNSAEKEGINHYVLLQDSHPAGSREFEIYPEHCVQGSEEAKTIAELQELPQSYKFKMIPKNNINPGLEQEFLDWLAAQDSIRQFIVIGDCTDICIYQLAMFLKLRAIKEDRESNIVVPVDCVDTYDIPVGAAGKGVLPHPADVLHAVFLYHLAQNGIQVVGSIE